jgi:elongation factor P
MQIKATQLRVGTVINYKNDLYRVTNVLHITPGNWRGMVQTKLKNIKTGSGTEQRFRSEDLVEKADLSTVEMEYIYQEGDHYYFMNTETYEQVALPEELLGDLKGYLVHNTKVQVEYNQDQPVGIELPKTVNLKVIESEPTLKGATATASFKSAMLETGITIQVPQFVETGNVIKVDTAEGTYLERVR